MKRATNGLACAQHEILTLQLVCWVRIRAQLLGWCAVLVVRCTFVFIYCSSNISGSHHALLKLQLMFSSLWSLFSLNSVNSELFSHSTAAYHFLSNSTDCVLYWVGRDPCTTPVLTATIIVLSQSLKSHFKAILGFNWTVNDLPETVCITQLYRIHNPFCLIPNKMT